MKKILSAIMMIVLTLTIQAQNTKKKKKKFTQLSVRGGIDMAKKDNFTDFVKMPLKGLDAGLSVDKYWNWFGLGIDFDFLQNGKPVYDETALSAKLGGAAGWYNPTWLTTSTSASKLTRTFAGIGPSFKYQTNNGKFVAELNLRGGVTYTKGSGLNFSTNAAAGSPAWAFTRNGDATGAPQLSWGTFYHQGYNNDLIATAKAQVRLNYYIKPKLGVNLGTYYMHYFGSDAKYNYLDVNDAAAYWNLKPSLAVSALSSYGATIGLSYRLSKKQASKATASKSSLTVMVKDELTNLPLVDANVTVSSNTGIAFTGVTNAGGIVTFNKMEAGVYTVSGVLHDIPTGKQNVQIDGKNQTANTTLMHNDPRFTVMGKAINLSNSKPESGVSVTLKNTGKGSVKMTTSQSATGAFSFQLDGDSDYELVGKKASYLSNIEKITTKGLTRSQTLYVELEIGVVEVEKGKSLILQKIYYDLDKANITEDASSDLEKLTVFLQDNPTFSIEIASHTDSRGSDDYNLKLSQERAQAVKNYLTTKGINAGRLTARGYGETKLINKCSNGVNCTEEEHQLNRRTEFTVISN